MTRRPDVRLTRTSMFKRFKPLVVTAGATVVAGGVHALLRVLAKMGAQDRLALPGQAAPIDERVLRDRDERFALAVLATGLGSFEIDFGSGEHRWDPTARSIWGFGGDDPISAATIEARIDTQDRARARAAIDAARAAGNGAQFDIEHRIRRPDGSIGWLAMRGKCYGDPNDKSGKAVRCLGTTLDITERRAAAQALADSETRLRLALDATGLGIWDYDFAADTVVISERLRAVMGQREGAPLQLAGPAALALVLAEDRATLQASFARAIAPAGGGAAPPGLLDAELRIVRATDGALRWVALTGRLSFDDATPPRPLRATGTLRDVTDRYRIEQVLRDADRRKDEFLAVLAHELRNPLAPIRNAVQVIAREPGDVLAVTGAAAIMERQLRQMVRLIDDLLDVSRIARGKLKLHMEPVALQPIIDAAVETVRPKLLLKRQAFSCRLPEAPVGVRADAARLSQVIANVLHNASKYTPPEGSIALQARVDAAARTIEIDVTDTGVGIPAAALPGLFTMFSQVERADGAADGLAQGAATETKRDGAQEHDGLGIGLALARSLVELHGGTIRASSDGPGRGARFALRLPLSTAAPAGPRAAAVMRPAPPRRVLVVDDNQDSADSLAAMLRLDGHEVSVAYAGEAALALAGHVRPEIILLDIGLPDVDGHEVARRLRERERAGQEEPQQDGARQARIVALSGYGQAADRKLSFAAGCDGHLVKPVSHDELAPWLDPGRGSG